MIEFSSVEYTTDFKLSRLTGIPVKEHLAFTGEDSPMANLLLSVMELLQIRAGFDQGATGEGITRAGQSHLNHKIKFIS